MNSKNTKLVMIEIKSLLRVMGITWTRIEWNILVHWKSSCDMNIESGTNLNNKSLYTFLTVYKYFSSVFKKASCLLKI